MAEALTGDARRIALALVRALLPSGRRFEGGGEETLTRLEHMLATFGPEALKLYVGGLHVLEQAARLAHGGRPFSGLATEEAERFLGVWCEEAGQARRALAAALVSPLKVAHFDRPEVYSQLKCAWRFESLPERPRWMEQVSRGPELAEDLELECDAVVVGTGAGGAVVAKELAERGHAVVMLEEGAFHTRADFTGEAIENARKFYRERGLLAALGNAFISIPVGKLVGGSTAVNTATCWRTPERILNQWVAQEGLTGLTPEAMAPHFEQVEREIQVEPPDPRYLGGAAKVVRRGCEVLGYRSAPVMRNAPGCDGSSVCDFGCPTDARRSTNISYVPKALQKGAMLFTEVRAERLLMEGGRVAGVEGVSVEGGRKVRIRAKRTVLSCGALLTPLFLRRHKLANPHLGRNLSIHPATMISALFDEEIRGYSAIPQSYAVDEFQKEGILLLGASARPDIGAVQFAFVGQKLVDLMEVYEKVASFGVMVEDASRGRVVEGRGGKPHVIYWLGAQEKQRLLRGTELLSRIFLAAGAREVFPGLHGHRSVKSSSDLARLSTASPAAGDWLLMAFHPLGTCRMATSPGRGVVGPDYQVFGMPGLYVVDGSMVPSSLAVNPQLTIMALASRAAGTLAQGLERPV